VNDNAGLADRGNIKDILSGDLFKKYHQNDITGSRSLWI